MRKEIMMKRIRSIVIWLIILLISVLVSLWWDLGSLNDAFNQTILLKVRLPRVLEAMLTGATLTIACLLYTSPSPRDS